MPCRRIRIALDGLKVDKEEREEDVGGVVRMREREKCGRSLLRVLRPFAFFSFSWPLEWNSIPYRGPQRERDPHRIKRLLIFLLVFIMIKRLRTVVSFGGKGTTEKSEHFSEIPKSKLMSVSV